MWSIDGLSTSAKIGKILVMIALVLGVIGFLWLLFAGSLGFAAGFLLGGILGGFVLVLAVVELVGLVLGFLALKATAEKDFHRAGILAIVSAFLAPIDIIMLIGGILLIVSDEAKKRPKK